MVDTVHDWQEVFLRHARAAARVRGRRVLPAWPTARSPRPRPTRTSPCTRTASAWRARSRSSGRASPTRRRARAPASSPGSTARRPRAIARRAPARPIRPAPTSAPSGAPGRAVPPSPDAAPVGVLSGRSARAGAGPSGRRSGPGRRAGHPGGQRVLRRQHRRHRLDGRRRRRPHAGRRAGGPSLPAARRVPVEGDVPRRHQPRRPAPAGRDRGHRRGGTAGGPARRPRHERARPSRSSADPTWASRRS